jgi:hypothetical protein
VGVARSNFNFVRSLGKNPYWQPYEGSNPDKRDNDAKCNDNDRELVDELQKAFSTYA